MFRGIAALVLGVAVTAASGCGSNPVEPDDVDPFAGNWSGTLIDTARGTGTLTMALSEGLAGVNGSWKLTLAQQTIDGRAVAVANAPPGVTVTKPTASLTCPSGGVIAMAVTFSGKHMTGTHTALACEGLASGTFDLTKQ